MTSKKLAYRGDITVVKLWRFGLGTQTTWLGLVKDHGFHSNE